MARFQTILTAAGVTAGLAVVAAIALRDANTRGSNDPSLRDGSQITETQVAESQVGSGASTPLPAADQPTLVYARRFQVAEPFQHVWHREQPMVDSGWLVVVEAGAAELRPRQVEEAVLQVGDVVPERVNTGQGSGRLVLIVPGDVDLASAPIFFGPRDLPEEMTRSKRGQALADARAFGLGATEQVLLARKTEPGVLNVGDDFELRLAAIDLVERFAADEQELISGWRVPRVR